MNIIKEYLENSRFSGDLGFILFIVDVSLALLIFLIVTIILFKKQKRKIVFLISFIYLLLTAASIVFDLKFVGITLLATLPVIALSRVLSDPKEYKNGNRNYQTTQTKTPKNAIATQDAKAALINTLVETCEYFSSRKVGAIITIEKEQNLNVYIDKAVKLDAEVSIELLKTIFFPNTSLHDGAVIIRGNRIVCASAFYTPSDKPDIKNELGSRHRAAIGISEDSDAFTVVVSEETGAISTTLGGTITQGINTEVLRTSLNQHIVVE